MIKKFSNKIFNNIPIKKYYKQLKECYSFNFYEKIYLILKWLIIPFNKIEELIPKEGKILDIGCGKGSIVNYLALTSFKREVTGIDIDTKRIAIAKKSSKDIPNVKFLPISIFDFKEDLFKAVILSDVLHHINFNMQKSLLKKCFQIIKPTGLLLIKEVDRKLSVPYLFSWLFDWLFYRKKSNFRTKEDLAELLKNSGFNNIKVIPIPKVFSTVLFIGQK